jgi:anion-transporting  ArsA/GET3 family ATPase
MTGLTGPMTKRLLIVAGKGGVGRSTVTATLAVAARRRGLRTIVAETAGRDDVARMLRGRAADPLVEVELEHGLHHVTIERRAALEEYLRYEVPGLFGAAALARSAAFQAFVDAAPGMSDLLTIGKVWELVQRPRHKPHAREYDVVILDAPASGQLVGLLGAPRTFTTIARVGPVSKQAGTIERALRDPHVVGVIAVATPEQMAVSETLALQTSLTERFGIELDAVVANRVFPARFTSEDVVALGRVAQDPAVRSARWFAARAKAQRGQLVRLRRGVAPAHLTTLPFRFEAGLERADLERFADLLGAVAS